MKYQKGFAPLVVILLVVLGIGVVGGGYVLYKDKETVQNIPNSQPDTQVTQNETATIQKTDVSEVITAEWQTYKNDEFGLQIKYPSDFKIDPNVGSDLMLLEMKNDAVKEFSFSMVINRYPPSELLTKTLKQTCDEYRQVEKNEGKLLECKNVTINGVEYIKVVQEPKMNGGRAITFKGQLRSMFLMVITYIPPSQVGTFSNTVDSILSTIKF
jgi:hypothetical protein